MGHFSLILTLVAYPVTFPVMDSKNFMDLAFAHAEYAGRAGEVPVGAVVVDATGVVLASAHNLNETSHDPCAHAEVLAIQAACAARGEPRLPDCDLYVTLEPCAMCAAAISFARIRRLYFAAYDEKMGGVDHGARFYTQATCHHAPEVYGGIGEERGKKLLQDFFKNRRGVA